MSILFISHSKQQARYFNDPSARYRCIFPAENLLHFSKSAYVAHVGEVSEKQINTVDAVVFHRPSDTPEFQRVFSWAKSLGKRCVADYDDLLFAPDESALSAAVISGAVPETVAHNYAQDYLAALNCFDECIVSTVPLGDWVKRESLVNQVNLVPNRLPWRWFYQTDSVSVEERFQKKVLRYLPGTSHHDGDFDFIKSVLTEFLSKHSDVTLEVIGPLRFELSGLSEEQASTQLRHVKAVPFDQLAALMADSWVCIAPLLDTSFNQCKSGLKFWESGLYGVPLVASPLADFEDYRCAGLREVATKNEWISALTSLLDWERYQAASAAAAKSSQSVLHGSEPNPYVKLFELDTRRQAQGERIDADDIASRQPQSSNELLNHSQSENGEDALDKTLFYRVQQQFFASWFGPGWQAFILKPRIDIVATDMPGEVLDRAEQLRMLNAIWSKQHWSHELYGEYTSEKANRLPISLQRPPELPTLYQALMQETYSSWQEWVNDASVANQSLWQQQRQPVGSPLMRKWRKFRRSPKHFFEDSNNPLLKWFSRFF